MRVPFVGGENRNRSISVSAERTVNWYLEFGSKYPEGALLPRPGLKAPFTNVGAGEVRGMEPFGGDLYVAVAGEFKKVTSGGTVTDVGDLDTVSGPVSMAVNPTQLLVVDGKDGWVWDGSTLTRIADADFPNLASHAAYLDGRGIVNDANNAGRHYISAANDFTSWGSTDFATAQRDPDKLQAILVDHREAWMFGEFSTEVWFNSGDPSFPFEPFGSGFTEWGISAPHSAAATDGSVYWLGQSPDGAGIVLRSEGLRGVRISNHAIENAIAGYTKKADAIGWTMSARGHVFYVLTFPTGDQTFVYDGATGVWHEWKSLGIGRFRGNCHAFFNEKHYVGDYADGNIYELDFDTYSDNGIEIEHIRQGRNIISLNSRERTFHRAFEAEFEAGVGNADATDPQAMLQWSDDGGHTYSNEHWVSIGKVGEYTARARWRSLGRSRDRVYRVMVSDPVKAVLISAYLDLQVGAS